MMDAKVKPGDQESFIYTRDQDEKLKDDGEPLTFQYFLDLVGTKGLWNYMVFIMCAMCSFMSPLQSLSYQFLGDTPNHWCHLQELTEANWTQQEIVDFAIPVNDETGKNEGCLKHDYNYSAAAELGYEESLRNLDSLTIDGSDVECRSRDFNFTDFQSTTVTEWDLVCDKRYLYSTTFSASFFVRLFTSPFIGFVIDTFGRRLSILVSAVLFILCSFLAAAAPTYETYIILRVLIAQFDGCFYTASYVLSLELSGKAERSMVGVLFCIPWALGYMALPGIAYLVRDWRLLQVALTLPSLTMIAYFWVLPESPRWLILKGRHQEALEILKNAARVNKKPLGDDAEMMQMLQKLQSQEIQGDGEEETGCWSGLARHVKSFFTNLKELVRSWPLFRLTAVVLFMWFSSASVYYGVSLNAVNLSTNMYIYMFFGGLLELPSYLLLWPVVSFLGRKRSFIALYLVCGIAILAIPVLDILAPSAPGAIKVTLSLVGKVAVNMAFQLAYLYTGELYHTSQRSFVISLGNIFSAGGGALAPYINDLLVRKARWAPSATFSIVSITAAALSLVLPETKGTELPDSVDTVENSASTAVKKQ